MASYHLRTAVIWPTVGDNGLSVRCCGLQPSTRIQVLEAGAAEGGRVDLVAFDNRWLTSRGVGGETDATLQWAVIDMQGQVGVPVVVADVPASHAPGVARLATAGDVGLLMWIHLAQTVFGQRLPQLQAARISNSP